MRCRVCLASPPVPTRLQKVSGEPGAHDAPVPAAGSSTGAYVSAVFLVVAIVLLLVLPWPGSIIGLAAGLVCFGGEVLFWHRRVRRRRAAVGPQTLLGELGAVVSPCRPDGQVRVRGEIWGARCAAGADVGDTVEVVGRRRLTLLVELRASG